MTKKAIRISIDGSNSDVAETERAIMKDVNDLPGRVPASIRIASYQPDNPEILKSELGKVTRWLAGDERQNGNPVAEPDSEEIEDEKFTHQLKRALGPALKKLATDVWKGTEATREREEAKNNGSKNPEKGNSSGS